MIGQILKWFGLTILTVVLLGFLKDLACYLRYRQQYKDQGINFHYIPLIGILYNLLGPLHKIFESKDGLKNYQLKHITIQDSGAKHLQIYETRKDEDIIATNHMDGMPYLLVQNINLINELMLKDGENFVRDLPYPIPIGLAFFLKQGQTALHERGIFSSFFHYQKLSELIPQMDRIFRESFKSFAKSLSNRQDEFPDGFKFAHLNTGKNDGYKSVNMRIFVVETMSVIIKEVLFGGGNMEDIDGITVPMAIEKVFDLTSSSLFDNPLNALCGGLLGKYKLLEPARKAWTLADKVKNAVEKEYNHRCATLKDLKDGEANNLLDLYVMYNRKQKDDQKMPIELIIETIVALKLAAMDTSKSLTESMLNHFVNNIKDYEWFKNNLIPDFKNADLSKYETLTNSEKLVSFIKEVIRLYVPSVLMVDRKVTKDTQVGKYKIYKGTKFTYALSSILRSQQFYKNPLSLDPERFLENSEGIAAAKKGYVAFSIGKRNCIGRHFAEAIASLMLINIGLHLDIKPVEGLENGAKQSFTLVADNAYVRVKAV